MSDQAELPIPAPPLRPVPVVLDALLRLPPGLPEVVYQRMSAASTFPNPEYDKRRRYGLWLGGTPRTLDLSARLEDGSMTCPRALTGELRAALANEGLRAAWDDRRTTAPLDREFPFSAAWESRPYQEEIVAVLSKHQNVLAHAPVAAGKTCVGLLALAVLRQRTIALVPKRNLADQWVEDCRRFLGFTPRLVGMGAKKTHPTSSPLTVATQQALYRCAADEAPYFGVLFLDECAHVSARTWQSVVVEFGAKYRIGASDDSTRHDKAQGMTYAHLGQPRHEVSFGELAADGKVVPCVLRVIQTGYVPRGEDGAPLPHAAVEPSERQRRQTEDLARNQLVAAWVLATLNPEQNSGLVLSYRVEHCHWFHQALNRSGLRTGLLLGGVDQKDALERCKRDLRSGAVACAAGTIGAVGEGFNVKRLDRGYLACAGSQNVQVLKQLAGRFARPEAGKGLAEVFYFSDGLLEPDARLTEEENRAHRGFAAAQVAGLRRLVRENPDRFEAAWLLGRDGKTWVPLIRE